MTDISSPAVAPRGLFRRPRVRTRLYAGFLSLILVAMILTATGIWAVGHLHGRIATLAQVDAKAERVLSLQTLLETIRRVQTRFMLDGNEAAAEILLATQTKAQTVLGDQMGSTISPQRQATYKTVAARLSDQIAGSTKLLDLGHTAAGARARMISQGDLLTAASDKMMAAMHNQNNEALGSAASQLERAILLVRVENWRFLATRDPAGVDTFHAVADTATKTAVELDLMVRTLENTGMATPDARATIAPARDALDGYRRDFDIASVAILGQTALFNDTLVPLIGGMQTELAKAAGQLTSLSAATSQEADSAVALATIVELTVAAAGIILGGGLAFLIGRSILRPLAGMTGAMTRLANGDHKIDIPARGNADEMGDMARAVEVFRHNSMEAARLAAEQTVEHEDKRRRAEILAGLVRDFEAKASALAESLASSATELQATATSMSGTAAQTNDQAASVASAAQQMSASIQTIAASAEELQDPWTDRATTP